MKDTRLETNAWTRQPWVWMLIAIPFSSVIMGVVMITLAIQSDSGLVVDDYYKKGKQINRLLARDRRAYELDLAALLILVPDQNNIKIQFFQPLNVDEGNSVALSLVHATKPGLDQQIMLKREGDRGLTGEFAKLGEGRWNLHLQTNTWRLTGSLQRPHQASAELKPNYFGS